MDLNIKEWINENREDDYKKFSQNLIKTKDQINGIRMGKLRSLAKTIAKEYGLDGLELLSDDSYEEILLQGLVIGYCDELIEIKEYFIHQYLLKCDNWSSVDTFCSTLKLKGIEKDIFYSILDKWRDDSYEYVIRFCLVYAMQYLDDQHINDILAFSSSVLSKTRQVKMANGWLLATAYIHYGEKVRSLLGVLDEETYHYTKGKINDSYRISLEEKKKFVR